MSEGPVDEALRLGLEHHEAGRLAEAQSRYQAALSINPDHPLGLNLLGVLTRQLGDDAGAEPMLRRAAALDPNEAQFACDLAGLLHAGGRTSEALAEYQRAVALDPAFPEAQFGFALTLGESGRFAEAIDAGKRLRELAPDDPTARQLLSAIHHNYALALEQRNQLDEAAQYYRKAIAIQPDRAESHYCLGNVLRTVGSFADAIAEYSAAVALRPTFAEAHANLGGLLARQAQPDEAREHLETAIKLNPNLATAHPNLGGVYKDVALIPQAVESYRKALQLDPTLMMAHSGLIYAMHFDARYEPDTIYQESLNWARQHAERFYPPRNVTYANDRDVTRRIRIGYVSAHFYHHVIGMFLEPLLANHDRGQFEVICYSGVVAPDAATTRFQSYADQWHDVRALDDDALAARIRGDGIDILVDLSGHIEENRLLVFARKPAPIQVTYLGYPDTTGLATIDYRFTDAYHDPPGATERWHSEKLARIADSAWCFQPFGDIPNVSEPPLRRAGHLTFGSLNIVAKVQDSVIETWARVMREVPDSRLRMLVGNSAQVKDRVESLFAGFGIDPARLTLMRRLPRNEYLRVMDEIDLGLDPFPFNGHTTSMDLLYQGIPFITLAGQTHVQRAGVSLLMNMGLGDLIANDVDEYVHIAVGLARDAERLGSIRAALRARMQNSVLMDAPRFARNVEGLYRQMWETWCGGVEGVDQ
jgi:predicted O-linked N-acetylglucosamine transferase (SPINDLY family)